MTLDRSRLDEGLELATCRELERGVIEAIFEVAIPSTLDSADLAVENTLPAGRYVPEDILLVVVDFTTDLPIGSVVDLAVVFTVDLVVDLAVDFVVDFAVDFAVDFVADFAGDFAVDLAVDFAAALILNSGMGCKNPEFLAVDLTLVVVEREVSFSVLLMPRIVPELGLVALFLDVVDLLDVVWVLATMLEALEELFAVEWRVLYTVARRNRSATGSSTWSIRSVVDPEI